MRWKSILLLTLCLQAFYGYSQASSSSGIYSTFDERIDPNQINTALLSQAIFRATNQIRREFELDTLMADASLDSAASIHANFLRKNTSLVHINNKVNALRTPALRVQSTGADPSVVAENLARMSIFRLGKNGQFFVDERGNKVDRQGNPLPVLTYRELAEKVTQGWLNSPGHRENLLGPFTHIGLAEMEMMTGKEILTELVFVQNFGKY